MKKKPDLMINPTEFGIEESKASELIGNLPQIKAERNILEAQYSEVIKLDIDNPETQKKARELRLLIRDNRTKGIDVWHKTTKEFFLKGGQFVDAIKRKEIAVNERMEENLTSIEKHFENLEKERKARLNAERISILEPFNAFVPMGLNFGEVSEEEFAKILNGAKLQFEHQQAEEARIEAEKQRLAEIQKLHNERKEIALPYYQFWEKEEKDMNFGEVSEKDFNSFIKRLKNSKAEHEAELDRIRKENEKLAKEKADAEAKAENERKIAEEKLAKERAEQEKKLKAEQNARARIEADLQAKKDAEAQAERDRLEEEDRKKKEAEKLAKAPIKKQLSAWVNSFEIPETTVQNDKAELIKAKFEAFKKWSLSEIESL